MVIYVWVFGRIFVGYMIRGDEMLPYEIRWIRTSEHNFDVKYKEKVVIAHFLMEWRHWLMGEWVLVMTNHLNRSDLAI